MLAKLVGYVCVGIALVLVGVVAFRTTLKSPGALTFSPTELLSATWQDYKNVYVDPTYRTIDKQRGVTTSEGQSYTMLRAAWMGDKPTFDGSWEWTRDNLSRGSDHLFAWLWAIPSASSSPSGRAPLTGHIISSNTASDADSDIALALVFAYARWQDPQYLDAARAIINDIWQQEVIVINGTPYLAADNVEKNSKTPYLVVNPSYLSPASYHIFAEIDPTHPWDTLRAASYTLLSKAMDAPLGASGSAHLPPDWVFISRKDGSLMKPSGEGFDTNFGYDALRTPWRVALDYQWFKNPSALSLLHQFSALGGEWKSRGKLAAIHAHDGSVVDGSEAAALYGGVIGYFSLADPRDASAVYSQKLTSLYNAKSASWATTLSYYDANWVWFGIALYNNLTPNLAAELPPSAFGQ